MRAHLFLLLKATGMAVVHSVGFCQTGL